MTQVTEYTVIQPNDPLLADRHHLDFQFLRAEGLKHIQELSGDIWTDHNTHDPGITILETLCYALLDLGYRATQPVQDLLATEVSSPLSQEFPKQDSFFTPLEILTCNPTTISDYRKLLLEVDGVRNAWLEPAVAGPATQGSLSAMLPKLYLVKKGGSPHCLDFQPAALNDPQIDLSGLYRIVIEVDPEAGHDKKATIVGEIHKLLSAHRNLCEDFQDLVVLTPLKVGVHVDVEVKRSASAAEVYEEILKRATAHITPEIRYYTLQQLLKKDKPIEDIFAGRPYLESSVGFIDTEELENLPRRKALHASDLYQIFMDIEGVVAIRQLSFQAAAPGRTSTGNVPNVSIPEGCIAAFSVDLSCIELSAAQNPLQWDRSRAHKVIPQGSKARFKRTELDLPVPQGSYRPELGEYISLQHEFPQTYGIGEGGLSEEAPLRRKVQALQLKGYLLFFDQLLADYLAQLVNVSSLFALRTESARPQADRRTFFSQSLATVPGIVPLLQTTPVRDLADRGILATPVPYNDSLKATLATLKDGAALSLVVQDNDGKPPEALQHHTDASDLLREIGIQRIMRDMGQGDYKVEIHQDRGGHFFILRFTQHDSTVLLGYLRYADAGLAREGANLAAFLATSADCYWRTSLHENGRLAYRYDLVCDVAADARYLQHLLEDEKRYAERRSAFLDHLLARFASQFTDFALLQYQARPGLGRSPAGATRENEAKSRLLTEFAESSRNRGRAFDYLEPAWLTTNVSGFEKRVSLLAGMAEWKRRRLCKFEVVPSLRLEVTDTEGKSWISSEEEYYSWRDLEEAQRRFLENPNNEGMGANADAIRRMLSKQARPENIAPSGSVHGLEFIRGRHQPGEPNGTFEADSEEAALVGAADFEKKIREKHRELELMEVQEGSRVYLDQNYLKHEPREEPCWVCVRQDKQGNEVPSESSEDEVYPGREAALRACAGDVAWDPYITHEGLRYGWQIMGAKDQILLKGLRIYGEKVAAIRALLEAAEAAQQEKNLSPEDAPEKKQFRILLRSNAGGRELGSTPARHYPTAAARNAALKKLRKAVKEASAPPFEIAERTMHGWRLNRLSPRSEVRKSHRLFPTQEEAWSDFASAMIQWSEEPLEGQFEDDVQHLYRILPASQPRHFRFIYCINGPDGKALPLLESKEYNSKDEAISAYADFVKSLPSRAALPDAETTLVADTPENQERVKRLLEIFRKLKAGTKPHGEANPDDHRTAGPFVFRLVDLDYPLAATPTLHKFEGQAKEEIPSAQDFTPYPFVCGDSVVQVIRPKGTAGRYHYAISLRDEADAGRPERRVLISYIGYADQQQAQKAGEEHSTRLIEIAADEDNYGEGKRISLEERYGTSTAGCLDAQPFLAVMARKFRDTFPGDEAPSPDGAVTLRAVTKAVSLARRYPIRIRYQEDKEGKLAPAGYYFQGFRLIPKESLKKVTGEVIWEGLQTYDTVPKAVDHHQVFATLLKNRINLRSMFVDGFHRLQMVEVLAQSLRKFDTQEEAWGECRKDECQQHAACRPWGVCQFADVAIYEEAYHLREVPKGCYRFQVVSPDYRLARHTCTYDKAAQRDEAIEKLGTGPDFPDWHTGKTIDVVNGKLRFYVDAARYLESKNKVAEFEQEAVVELWLRLGVTHRCYRVGTGESNHDFWQLLDSSKGDAFVQGVPAGDKTKLQEFIEGLRRYPIFRKDGLYRFRLYFSENGGVLDEELPVCECKPPQAGKSAETPPFCGKPHIFESVRSYPSKEAAMQMFRKFLKLLNQGNAYHKTAGSGLGPYSFDIINRAEILAAHPTCHPDSAGAMSAAARARACLGQEGMHLVEHILLRPVNGVGTPPECLLTPTPVTECDLTWEETLDEEEPCGAAVTSLRYIPGADPYSFCATAVLPSWYPRFKAAETRGFFREMLHREAPATVALNILWLRPRQMEAFDQAYRNWLESRSGSRLPDCRKKDEQGHEGEERKLKDPTCALIECLKALNDDPPCASDPSAISFCECSLKIEANGTSLDEPEPAPAPAPAPAPEPDADTAPSPQQVPLPHPVVREERDRKIRELQSLREADYKENIRQSDSLLDPSTELHGLLQFTLTTPPSVDHFERVVLQVLNNDLRDKSSAAHESLLSVLRNLTWWILDRLVIQPSEREREKAEAQLPPLFSDMKARSMDLNKLAADWKGERLEELLHTPAVPQYREMLEKT